MAEFFAYERMAHTRRFNDRTGQRYGRLVAIAPLRRVGSPDIYWRCQCDCGKETIVKIGSGLSCGCWKNELFAEAGRPYRKKPRHGHATEVGNSRTYRIWAGMKRRCLYKTDPAYYRYGGRGITVDPSWERFDNFLADMGEAPAGMQIDRIDNDAGYSKSNCRWVTPRVNMNNRCNTRRVVFEGRTLSLSDLARERCIRYGTLVRRLRLGWSIELAATQPVEPRRPFRPRAAA